MKWLLLALVAALLAGCADDPDTMDDAQDGQGSEDPAMEARANTTAPAPDPVAIEVALTGVYPSTIAYDPVRIEVPAGAEVTLTFTNNDGNPLVNHDWVLEGVDGAATEVIGNGESDTITFTAPAAGEYAFYCSVPGHRGNGMEGVFVVTE